MREALYDEQNITFTENGAKAYCSTGTDCLDFFAAVGALRKANRQRICDLFVRAYAENKDLAMRTLFYARDICGGLGERRLFRILLRYAAFAFPESVCKNLALIPDYGRYDDCLVLLGTPCEQAWIELVRAQLRTDLEHMEKGESVSLLAKWLPSVNASSTQTKRSAKTMAQLLSMSEKEYRSTLSRLRSHIGILETQLCKRTYRFQYDELPSKAMLKYRQAFLRNDRWRYQQFLDEVKAGEKKLHASCVYPYEIIRQCMSTAFEEEREALDVTWRSLPDYTDNRNAIAVVDGSGSMYYGGIHGEPLSGKALMPITVAVSLGLYFAERNKGLFHNCFITFSNFPRLVKIKGEDVYEKANYCMSYNECSNTDLYKVFMLLLSAAVKNKIPQEELPETIYIISDMEFDVGVDSDQTVFEAAKRRFEKCGYRLPNVIYWNVESRHRQYPVTKNEKGVALVSGCSPIVFEMVMDASMTPEAFMLKTLDKERYRRIAA